MTVSVKKSKLRTKTTANGWHDYDDPACSNSCVNNYGGIVFQILEYRTTWKFFCCPKANWIRGFTGLGCNGGNGAISINC